MKEADSSFSFETQDAAPAASDSLSLLNEKLAEAISLKECTDQMEEDLAAAKKQLNNLNTQIIPDMMAEMGMEEVTQRGWKVKVGEFVSGSLPKEDDRKAAAIRWLEENDGGELLKTQLSVVFTRSQHNEAMHLAGFIQEEGFAPKVESTVHPQTLMAFARERLKNGESLDTEVLGLYTGRVAKFKRVGD